MFIFQEGEIKMENSTSKIIQEIKDTNHPSLKAMKLSSYLSDLLKNNSLNMYEAYLLEEEIIKYKRDGYMLPAWNDIVSISTCLEILNQRLLAIAFGDMGNANRLKKWGMEALSLCGEKRPHYIMDKYIEFINISSNNDPLLQELLEVRRDYMLLSFEEGPYHLEVFPYDDFETERILLENINMREEKNISEEMEKLLIELYI